MSAQSAPAQSPLTARERLAFPLDYPTLDQARAGAAAVASSVGVLKIGLELFTRAGPASVEIGASLDLPVFLDLKLHDIPQTVESAVASAAALGVRYLTVHACGGPKMLAGAARAAARAASPLTLLAVTVLTSLDDDDLRAIGVTSRAADQALTLAELAWREGVRGFVASPAEVGALRSRLGAGAVLVIPGIRPEGSAAGDQKRIATPRTAIEAGADLLVVGRPIRDAASPLDVARDIVREIDRALSTSPRPSGT
jgi:orotidine-5'-phosphate decarboxylase